MKTVKVYIETTITGPSKPKYGKYAAALAFTRKTGRRKTDSCKEVNRKQPITVAYY